MGSVFVEGLPPLTLSRNDKLALMAAMCIPAFMQQYGAQMDMKQRVLAAVAQAKAILKCIDDTQGEKY